MLLRHKEVYEINSEKIRLRFYYNIHMTIQRIMFASSPQTFRTYKYGGANNSLARPASRCILFDGENISFDASLVIYININNIPPIMIINKIYEHQNLLSL